MTVAQQMAQQNFEQYLQENPYPGRGLVVGRTDPDAWVLIYWIMGRSAASRNRCFVAEGEVVRTEAVDPTLVADPSLIIYEAMLALPGIYIVGNGDQTRTVYDVLLQNGRFDEALHLREREPDAPHYTPRITGMLRPLHTHAPCTLSILKANPADPALTDRFTYRPAPPPPGLGWGLTTYQGDGNPLPAFTGDPLLLPCQGDAQTILTTYWEGLNKDNRVAIAVKSIQNGKSRLDLINQY